MQIPLGKVVVTTAGTPEKATKNGISALIGGTVEGLRCQSYQIQALPTNTGLVYIGNSTLVKGTLVGVHSVLPAPASATSGPFPSQSFSVPMAANALNLNDVYLDVSVSGEGVVITLIQQ